MRFENLLNFQSIDLSNPFLNKFIRYKGHMVIFLKCHVSTDSFFIFVKN